tara:strand:- start:304 stop:513 length:210 start_codon:yes stop_codon:yes gene_type:complete
MEGEFKIKVGRSIYTYTNFNDIPKEIGAVISFNPKYPKEPHTEEEHKLIKTFNDKLQELMKRECQRLRE